MAMPQGRAEPAPEPAGEPLLDPSGAPLPHRIVAATGLAPGVAPLGPQSPAIAGSPLRGRVSVAAAATAGARVIPRAVTTALFGSALGELAIGYQPQMHEGPGVLCGPEEWLGGLRELADAMLLARHPSATPLVLEVPEQERARAVLRSLYPDATEDASGAISPPAAGGTAAGPKLLLVLGCARSGTTWLEGLLMAHPAAGGVEHTETFVFALARKLWRGLDDPRGTGQLVDHDTAAGLLRRFFDGVFTAALRRHRPGASHFVEKTPLHSLCLDVIAPTYPDAYALHLIRDGRDVAQSVSEVAMFGLPDIADAGRLWTRVLAEVRDRAPELRHYREIRYEQLRASPVPETAALLEWCGLDLDVNIRDEVDRRSRQRVSTHAGTSRAVGRHTWHELPRRDLARLYAEIGRALVAEGYASAREVRRQWTHPGYVIRRLARARR